MLVIPGFCFSFNPCTSPTKTYYRVYLMITQKNAAFSTDYAHAFIFNGFVYCVERFIYNKKIK